MGERKVIPRYPFTRGGIATPDRELANPGRLHGNRLVAGKNG
ncbi:MAG: hypothetical protein ACTSUE_19670 [Promethearchaeota archaeon]